MINPSFYTLVHFLAYVDNFICLLYIYCKMTVNLQVNACEISFDDSLNILNFRLLSLAFP